MRLESHLGSGSGQREAVDLAGRWRNQHGSEMQLRVGPGGRLTGTYHTAVGAPSPKQEFELAGFACGDLVVFTVNFGRFGSLTAWTGQHTVADGVERTRTPNFSRIAHRAPVASKTRSARISTLSSPRRPTTPEIRPSTRRGASTVMPGRNLAPAPTA